MTDIPLPQSGNDIFNYGFDKNLNLIRRDVITNFSNSSEQSEIYKALELAGINVTKNAQQGNFFAGNSSGSINTTGFYNTFTGLNSGLSNTTGSQNIFQGQSSGLSNKSGQQNVFVGAFSGFENIAGSYNVSLGYGSGGNNNGDLNVFLGYTAGFYETGSNKLFIDNTDRGNEADGRIKALIYGVFNAIASGQTLTTNSVFTATYGITTRVGGTASSANPTPDCDTQDLYDLTALAAGATFGAPTGTPWNGKKLIIRIKDNGSQQTLAWNAIYVSGSAALPSLTVTGKIMHAGFIYNSNISKWMLVALPVQP